MKKVLVTGASGHVGNMLVRELYEQNYEVYSLVMPHDKIDHLTPYSKIIYGDILDKEGLKYNFQQMNYIVHAAGVIEIGSGNKKFVYKVNYEGTKNVLAAAQKNNVNRVIYISSVHALPALKKNQLMTEIDHFDPKKIKGHYGKSKAMATQYSLDFTKENDLDVVVVHLGSIVGEGDYKRSHMGTVTNMFLQKRLPLYLDGGYNFVDVKDVAKGIILAIEKGKRGECYLLTGYQKTIKEYLDEVAKVANMKPIKHKINYTFILMMSKFAEMYYKMTNQKPLMTTYSIKVLKSNSNFSNEKAKRELGFTTRPFEDTIHDVVNFNLELIKADREAKMIPKVGNGKQKTE